MSTELKTIKGRKETEFGYKQTEVRLTRFSGGNEGTMVQVNIDPDAKRFGISSAHVQLNQSQIINLIKELNQCLNLPVF